jgi:hypothetical protein
MTIKNKIKDSYGSLVDNKSFDEYWEEFHKIEKLSLQESIRQKKERENKKKLDNKK